MVTINYTDTSLPAIRAAIEKQLLKSDLITLTRGQVEALLAAADPQPKPES